MPWSGRTASRFAERAQANLEPFAPSYFADEDLQPEALPHRLRMDLFAGSVLAYMECKETEVEQAVAHDIATWIEANAPAVVSANLSLMEQALGRPGVDTHRDVVKLHRLIDMETYEEVQQHYLETTWAEIERSLADVLAAAAR